MNTDDTTQKPIPLNSGTVRNGKLDEGLGYFRTIPINDQQGMIAFQFESGGFTIAFKKGMTMTHVADKLEGTARRLRKYQDQGWPAIQAEGH